MSTRTTGREYIAAGLVLGDKAPTRVTKYIYEPMLHLQTFIMREKLWHMHVHWL